MSDATLEQVSVEDSKGRILTGVGGADSVEALEAVIEQHEDRKADPATKPASIPAATPEPVAEPTSQRNADGTFAKEPRGKKRIDQLTGEREAEKRAREAAEQERDDLRRQLEAARQGSPAGATRQLPQSVPADVQPAAQAARVDAGVARSKPTEAEIGTKYQSYADFAEDLADWKVEQRLANLNLDALIGSRIEADRASRAFRDTASTVFAKTQEVFPDFDAIARTSPTNQLNINTNRLELILSQPHAEHLIYRLFKEPQWAWHLTQLSDVEFGLTLGQVVTSTAVASPASTARTVAPLPPSPMQPVGGGSKTSGPSSADLANKSDFDFDRSGYREQRARERGVKTRY